jgi:spore coat protein B
MKDMLVSMEGKVIKVGRGGPESRTGQFLGGGSDYFVLLTKEDGVVYFHGQHLKSLTEKTKGGLGASFEAPMGFSVLNGSTFNDILSQLELTWVTINRGGPEKIEGVLNRVTDDYVSVIVNEEIIRLPIFHIKSISTGVMASENTENQDSSSENSNSNNSNSNNSSSNKSSNGNDGGGDFVARSRNRRR